MINSCVKNDLSEIDKLFYNLDNLAEANKRSSREIRGQLSGLLVVSYAAIYENCVKKILTSYADLFHKNFSSHVESKYSHLNSKVKKRDLESYLTHFNGDIDIFNDSISKYNIKFKSDVVKRYEQILNARHTYAHTNRITTSMDEGYKSHRIGKYIIFAFEKALFNKCLNDNILKIESHYSKAMSVHSGIISNSSIIISKYSGIDSTKIAKINSLVSSANDSLNYMNGIVNNLPSSCVEAINEEGNMNDHLESILAITKLVSSLKK